MRLICISDTHTHHNNMKYNLNDYIDKNNYNILIHSGDISSMGYKSEVTDFIHWYQNLKGFDMKIFISGNHDFCFERVNQPHHDGDYDWLKNLIYDENLSQSDCVYLEDSSLILETAELSRPIKFYGSPWQPEFHNWAFNLPRNGDELKQVWDNIPDDTDVLITHSPPYGIGDYTLRNSRVGCELLMSRVEKMNLLVHTYGHIHEGHGVSVKNNTIFVNSSICNIKYKPINEPQVIELKDYDGEIIASYISAE